jgi:hypothetical protein
MTASARSVFVFGIYLTGIGSGLLLIPNLVLPLLGFPPSDEVWSRVAGLLAVLIAFYYLQAARTELRPFFQWTVYARIAAFIGLTAFAIANLASPIIALLGVIDLATALWTHWTLRQESQLADTTAPAH